MQRIGIRQDSLTLLLLLFTQCITTHQLVYYLVSLRQIATLHQLHPFLYQYTLSHLVRKYLLQILKNRQQKLTSLTVIGTNRSYRSHRSVRSDQHPVQISRSMRERTTGIVTTIPLHIVLHAGRITLQSWVL